MHTITEIYQFIFWGILSIIGLLLLCNYSNKRGIKRINNKILNNTSYSFEVERFMGGNLEGIIQLPSSKKLFIKVIDKSHFIIANVEFFLSEEICSALSDLKIYNFRCKIPLSLFYSYTLYEKV